MCLNCIALVSTNSEVHSQNREREREREEEKKAQLKLQKKKCFYLYKSLEMLIISVFSEP